MYIAPSGLPVVYNGSAGGYAASAFQTGDFGSSPTVGTVTTCMQFGGLSSGLTYSLLFDGIDSIARWGALETASSGVGSYAGIQMGYNGTFSGNIAVHSFTYTGTSSSIWRENGVLLDTANIGNNSLAGLTLLNDYLIGESPRNSMCEFIIYNTVLTLTQIEQNETYLTAKWL
jgi:hypothetical protein